MIRKIARLINEDIDDFSEPDDVEESDSEIFDKCPACGSDYATIIDAEHAACPNDECEYFDEEYLDSLPLLVSDEDLPIRFTQLNRTLAKQHKYVGKPGVVIMYPRLVRRRIGEENFTGQQIPILHTKYRDVAERHIRMEEYLARLDPATRERALQAGWAIGQHHYPLDEELTIKFDDAIDKGHYFILFTRTKPITRTTSMLPKYLGKYAFVKRIWNPNFGKGWYELSSRHRALTCTKAYIKKMKIGDEIVIDRP